jgi:saccharopine dehydrogenase-like NADP-dependent oxidoreductase
MKQVLVLGSGMVAGPLVRHLLNRGHRLLVGTLMVDRAEAMIAGHPNGKAYLLDVQDEPLLACAVDECDLAVSLLPFACHPRVARLCITRRKPLVTTSYVSAEMRELDGEARAAGVTVLNEIGVDPGVDHMSAMRIIDGARRRGGRVSAFRSYCGGLPAPEANDNPFGYKFSWAPRGVLLAARDGRRVEVPPERLFRDMHVLPIDGLGDFEAYPNRDAVSYIGVYGLEGISTMYRGTLRNMGWCDSLHNYGRLGLLSLEEVDAGGRTFAGFMRNLTGCGPEDNLAAAVAGRLGIPRDALPVLNLAWLGMFSDRKIGAGRIPPLDILGGLMFEKLAFRPGERDMVALHHEFRIELPDGRSERVVSELTDFGIPHGDSAMSRTVGLPAAIAADLILAGKIRSPGVLRPVASEVYNPVLDLLSEAGIRCREKTEVY